MFKDDSQTYTGPSSAASVHSRWGEAVVLLLYLLTAAVIVAVGIRGSAPYSVESWYRTMAANDLLEGLSRGRQALVGSLRVAPLPTVMLAIAAAFPLVTVSQMTSVVIAAISALLLCWYVNGLWRSAGVHPAMRAAGGMAVLLLPPVAVSIQTGRSTMIFVALTVAGAGFLLNWLKSRRLRSLAYAAMLFGLSLTVCFQGLFVAIGAGALICVAIVLKKPEKGLMEGSGVIFATPVAYMILLWLGGNWLILGNPFFPLRGIARAVRVGHVGWYELLTGGCPWGTVAMVAVIGIGPFLPGLLSKKADADRQTVRIFAFGGAIAIAAVIAYLFPLQDDTVYSQIETGYVVEHLESRYDNTSFIVTGYAGYQFSREAGADEEDAWIHVMHLEQSILDKIMEDFRGRNVFLIVDAEELTEGWLDLGIEWVEPWTNIPEQLFFVDKIDSLIIFKVFSPPALAGR